MHYIGTLWQPGARVYYRYFILELLAHTGYQVYHALDVWTGRQIVIKRLILAPDNYQIPISTRKHCLMREAEVMAAFNHPSIPQIYDVLEFPQEIAVIMQFMSGKTVASLLAETTLTYQETYQLAWHICDVVQVIHCHTPTLLHLDIKPLNLIVRPEGNVALIDFGTARWITQQTWHEPILATPEYAAVELLYGKRLDVRADVYAVGVTLHDLFEDRPGGHELQEVIQQAVTLDPSRRFASVKELQQALRRTILSIKVANPN